jgi:hypothetical protein
VEVDAGLQARRLLQVWRHQLVGRARIRRRLQDHRAPRRHVLCESVGCAQDVGQVGHTLTQRGRHGDHGHVESIEVGGRGARTVPTRRQRTRYVGVGDVVDVRRAGCEAVDLAGVEIEADHVEAHLDRPHRQRQADVALADDHQLVVRHVAHTPLVSIDARPAIMHPPLLAGRSGRSPAYRPGREPDRPTSRRSVPAPGLSRA